VLSASYLCIKHLELQKRQFSGNVSIVSVMVYVGTNLPVLTIPLLISVCHAIILTIHTCKSQCMYAVLAREAYLHKLEISTAVSVYLWFV
jgi:hypothetical protein